MLRALEIQDIPVRVMVPREEVRALYTGRALEAIAGGLRDPFD